MKYFNGVRTAEEVKKIYFTMAKKLHSDINGGSDEAMKELNAEYSEAWKIYKDKHESIKEENAGTIYTADTPTNEAPDDFISIVKFILSYKDLSVELCGRWLWIGGNTKERKEDLKKMGCKWSQSKGLWSWHYDGDGKKWHKRQYSMERIRNTYGSMTFYENEQLLLA